MKWIYRFLFLILAGLLWISSLLFVLAQEAPLSKRLEFLWTQDIHLLVESKSLPKAWSEVKNMEFYGGTDVAKVWLNEIELPLSLKSEGTHTLEVLLVDWKENQKTGAMIQYNLVDQKTGNMVWELGRTLILEDKNSLYHQTRSALMNWLRH